MDQFPSENLPPELDELGKRMSEERPVASDRALDSVMTRAQGARRTRKSSLLWRSSAPRTPRKTITMFFIALLATGGMATASQAATTDILGLGDLLGGLFGTQKAPINVDLPSTDAAAQQYGECKDATLVRVRVDLPNLLYACVRVFPDGGTGECPAGGIRIPALPLACVVVVPEN